MNSATPLSVSPSCTAFLQGRQVGSGAYPVVAQALAALDLSAGGLLVFDDARCTLVDFPWPMGWDGAATLGGGDTCVEARVREPAPAAPPGVGRPKLGVVAREVTLLPRHWDWLAQQRGGASAALRMLVEEARRAHVQRDAQRLAKECCYRFMSAVASDWPGFEEASRALFAQDGAVFAARTAHWTADVQAHLAWLTRDAFAPAWLGVATTPTVSPPA